jgi:hypothetical protein
MKRTRLRRVSKKREHELKIYYSLRSYMLKKRPYCEMPSRTGAPSCLNAATDIHHIKGRAGSLLCNVKYWLPVCPECHRYIHDHANEMRARKVMQF